MKQELCMKKLLITGASGFLGKVVLQKLIDKNQYEIYAITTNSKKLAEFKGINIVNFDLTQISQINNLVKDIGPEICVHLAWDQTKPDFRMSDSNILWLKISIELLHSFKKNGGKKFFFAGSSSEYDGATGTFKESDNITPVSLYGLCKKMFTEFGCGLNGVTSEFSFISARFFTIYGLGDTHDFGAIPSLVRSLRNNETIICNSPYTTRDYIYVNDAAQITCELLKSDFRGVMNVASGTNRFMKDVFIEISKIFDKEALVKFNEENKIQSEFNADITILREYGFDKYITGFTENIKKEMEKLV